MGHGMRYTPTYQSWRSMKGRCDRPNDPGYPIYGGRGISYCVEWGDFNAFFRDMGVRPEGLSLDRIDNDGNYSKQNCRWATAQQQSANRTFARKITFNGETLCYSEWERKLGFGNCLIGKRLALGWSIERIMTTPPLTWKEAGVLAAKANRRKKLMLAEALKELSESFV